jgi:serine protease Do
MKIPVVLDDLEAGNSVEIGKDGSGRLKKLGMTVRQLTPELSTRLRLQADQGVVISRLDPDGLAAKAGLEVGDIIIMLNNSEVANVEQLKKALRQGRKAPYLRFLVQRRGMRLFVVIRQRGK